MEVEDKDKVLLVEVEDKDTVLLVEVEDMEPVQGDSRGVVEGKHIFLICRCSCEI